MFSFQTLLKGTSSLLTCHLQFSITARVSMTLKRQSVQRLSDHKTVRTGVLCKPRIRNSRTNGLKQNEWSFSLVWSREGLGGGGRVSETGARTEKYDSKNTIETDNEKIKERKQERKK